MEWRPPCCETSDNEKHNKTETTGPRPRVRVLLCPCLCLAGKGHTTLKPQLRLIFFLHGSSPWIVASWLPDPEERKSDNRIPNHGRHPVTNGVAEGNAADGPPSKRNEAGDTSQAYRERPKSRHTSRDGPPRNTKKRPLNFPRRSYCLPSPVRPPRNRLRPNPRARIPHRPCCSRQRRSRSRS